MKGHRLFDRFGFDLPKITENKTARFTPLHEYENWIYDSNRCDWINSETEEALSGYILPSELNLLLGNNIDTLKQ